MTKTDDSPPLLALLAPKAGEARTGIFMFIFKKLRDLLQNSTFRQCRILQQITITNVYSHLRI
jgi:hypothetical protein